MGALLTVALVAGEELLIDSLSGLGLIEVWTEIVFNVGPDGILIPLTETSFYTISNGGYAAAAITGSVTNGSGLAGGIVNHLSKSALNTAVNQGSVLATNILEKTKSLNFWANIDSRIPLNSPLLLKDVIHETLQEIYPKTKLECFRSNKRRIRNPEKKGLDRREKQRRVNRFKGKKSLEIVSGATVHNIASASAYFPIIVQSDFVKDSRKLLKLWLSGDSSLDWTEFLNLPAKLEKPEGNLYEVRQKLESRIRSMVKAVVHCDILSDGVLKTEDLTPESSPPYDLIISVLCLEVPCLNFESFVNVLKRLNKLLRKGGGILISSVLDIEDWEVEGKKFPHLKIDLKDILLALDTSGFGNHVVKYMSPKNPSYEELQYEYYCIASEKLQ
ncbi:hypothetical protein AVEN_15023-1 [Araneus ventricosus]|uniref:Uncharacterized protein n=1 Tax=Araneus ventricosus TaxID=182803 RepID=A0A4Y2FVV0_ARAVE|nr:hypothetical protein AVEN_15023-1 [Araneus ventricosus]